MMTAEGELGPYEGGGGKGMARGLSRRCSGFPAGNPVMFFQEMKAKGAIA